MGEPTPSITSQPVVKVEAMPELIPDFDLMAPFAVEPDATPNFTPEAPPKT